MLGYAACVWLSVVYLADHYVIDVVAGIAYASAAYWAVIHAPSWFRRVIERAADDELEASVEAAEAGDASAVGRLGRRVRWTVLAQGLAVAAVGGLGAAWLIGTGMFGGTTTPLYLIPWIAILGGLWRAAAGLVSR